MTRTEHLPRPAPVPAPPVYRGNGGLSNAKAFRDDPLAVLARAHADAPDVVRIPLIGPLALVSVRHPDGARRILADNHANYVKGRTYDWLRRSIGLGLLTADGDEHRWRRKVILPGFARTQVHELVPSIVDAVRYTEKEWERHVDSTVDVHRELVALTLRVIGRALFRTDFTSADADLRDSLQEGSALVRRLLGSVSQFLPNAIPTPTNRALRGNRRRVDAALRALIGAHRSAAVQQSDVLGRLLAAKRYDVPERRLFDELVLLVGAGHETTANMLSWTLVLLAQHPEIEARARAECIEALGDGDPTAEALARLPYLRAVLNESLRLMPPAWGILRQAREQDEVCGFTVPAGSFVVISPYLIQRDPRWYADPLTFRPERHLDAVNGPPRFAYLPFGAGPRACVGGLLSEVEGMIALAMLLRRFRLRLAPGQQVIPETLLTVQPRGGLSMRLEAAG